MKIKADENRLLRSKVPVQQKVDHLIASQHHISQISLEATLNIRLSAIQESHSVINQHVSAKILLLNAVIENLLKGVNHRVKDLAALVETLLLTVATGNQQREVLTAKDQVVLAKMRLQREAIENPMKEVRMV